MQSFGGVPFSLGADLVSAELDTEDTWSEEYVNGGPAGSWAMVPITCGMTGTVTVTVQMARPGGGWIDYGDTAGGVNTVKILPNLDLIVLPGGWRMRAGIKTGHVSGGSANITMGTH